MKNLVLSFSLSLIVFQYALAQPCSLDKINFIPGERLEYEVYYNLGFIWIGAGNFTTSVSRTFFKNNHALRLMAAGKTKKSFNSFFLIGDTLVTYVRPNDITPIESFKFAHENTWHGIDDISFYRYNSGWKITTRLNRRNQWHEGVESFTNNCGFDALTCFYRMRCMNRSEFFTRGSRKEIFIRLYDGEYKVTLTYLGKDSVFIHGNGKYNANVFEITLVEGKVFGKGGVMKIWVSDDDNMIPLLVESPLRIGKIKIIFKSGRNTKYPLPRPYFVNE